MPVYDIPYNQFRVGPTAAFPNGRVAKRPTLIVEIINVQQTLKCIAVVDSGAGHCVFPRSFMQPLGINALNCPNEVTTGVGGTSPTHFAAIQIDLGAGVIIPVYAGFTDGLDAIGLGLLGQTGFFERFNGTFRHSQ